MQLNNISIAVVVAGREVSEYVSPMNFQTYIEGRDGSDFEIRVRNNTNDDIEAIISVDGLSITDGESAGSSSRGYIVSRYATVTIPGWKLDGKAAAKFCFSGKKGESYSEQSGHGRTNLGVIGIMAFARKRTVSNSVLFTKGTKGMVSMNAMRSYSTGSITTSASDSLLGQNLGTGFGDKTQFNTTSVEFERGDMVAMMELFYDDRQGLKAVGINVSDRRKSASAFPADEVGCKPPVGWGAEHNARPMKG